MTISNHSAATAANDEWYTPPEYIESARRVLGVIDVDPASNPTANEWINAGVFYSLENSAFDHEWCGRIWLNPPYSRAIKYFIAKLIEQIERGNVAAAIVVTNNGTDTAWFHQLAAHASAFCLHRGRIGFVNAAGARVMDNTKGQVFYYVGAEPEKFAAEFSQYGLVLFPYRQAA